jgi:pimeloyl-ACP methyl ester carboxylesterase
MRLRTPSPAAFVLLAVAWQGCRTAAAPEPLAGGAESAAVAATDRELPAGFRAEMTEAPVFGGQVFVFEGGNPYGPVVVLVHGLGENGSRDFYPVLPALAPTYHVIGFDLPGFGRSSHGTELYSPENYAELIHALVGQLLGGRFPGPFNLVGHSMGGAISLMYADRYPATLQRLFLIDAAGFLHRKAYVNFAIAAGLDNVLGIFSGAGKDLLDTTLDAAAQAIGPLPPAPEPGFLLKSGILRASILRTPTRIAALATMLEDFGPVIAEVRTPTWVLWGRNDNVASLRTAKILETRLPQVELRVLEASGHDPMASQPAEVSRFLLEGLAAPPVLPAKLALPPASRTAEAGRCEGKNDARFQGEYSEIEINNCQGVRLEGVRSRSIRIRDSVATFENVQVDSDGLALEVSNSKVEITASDFVGDVALTSSTGDIDLAGVNLRGKSRSVRVDRASRLIFSACRIDSPVSHRFVHELLELGARSEL